MKTNKSYSKRIKKTKNGKLLCRKAGENHYNAKKSRSKQTRRSGKHAFMLSMSKKSESRFIQQ